MRPTYKQHRQPGGGNYSDIVGQRNTNTNPKTNNTHNPRRSTSEVPTIDSKYQQKERHDGDKVGKGVQDKHEGPGVMQAMPASHFSVLQDVQEDFSNLVDEIQSLKYRIRLVEGPTTKANKGKPRGKNPMSQQVNVRYQVERTNKKGGHCLDPSRLWIAQAR